MRIRKKTNAGIIDLVAADDVSTIQGIGFSWIRNIKVYSNSFEIKFFH